MRVRVSGQTRASDRTLINSYPRLTIVVGECVRFEKDRFKHNRKLNMSLNIASQAQSRISSSFCSALL
jgi:hypothetical protein